MNALDLVFSPEFCAQARACAEENDRNNRERKARLARRFRLPLFAESVDHFKFRQLLQDESFGEYLYAEDPDSAEFIDGEWMDPGDLAVEDVMRLCEDFLKEKVEWTEAEEEAGEVDHILDTISVLEASLSVALRWLAFHRGHRAPAEDVLDLEEGLSEIFRHECGTWIPRLSTKQAAPSLDPIGLVELSAPSAAGVYFIQFSNRVKIGKSTNIRDRFNGLRTSSPAPLRLVAYEICAPDQREKELHAQWAPLRRHLEWFELAGGLLEVVRELNRTLR